MSGIECGTIAHERRRDERPAGRARRGARRSFVGCTGYERETTPFLDQVAREGVRFTHAFTTAPSSARRWRRCSPACFRRCTARPRSTGCSRPARARAAGAAARRRLSHGGVLSRSGDRARSTASAAASIASTPQRGGGRITGRAADYARRASDRVLGRGDAGARRTHAGAARVARRFRASRSSPLSHYREPLRPLRPPAPYDRIFMPPADAGAARQPIASRWRPGGRRRRSGCARRVARRRAALRRPAPERDRRRARGRRPLGSDAADRHRQLRRGSRRRRHGRTVRASLRDAVLHVPLLLRCPGRIPRGFVVRGIRAAGRLCCRPSLALAGCALDAPVQGRPLLTRRRRDGGPEPRSFAEAFRGARRPTSAVRRSARGARSSSGARTRPTRSTISTRDPRRAAATWPPSESERADRLRRALFDWLADGQRWAARRMLCRSSSRASGAAPVERRRRARVRRRRGSAAGDGRRGRLRRRATAMRARCDSWLLGILALSAVLNCWHLTLGSAERQPLVGGRCDRAGDRAQRRAAQLRQLELGLVLLQVSARLAVADGRRASRRIWRCSTSPAAGGTRARTTRTASPIRSARCSCWR